MIALLVALAALATSTTSATSDGPPAPVDAQEALRLLLQVAPCDPGDVCLPEELAALERGVAACSAEVQTLPALARSSRLCADAVGKARAVQARVRMMRLRQDVTPGMARALELVEATAQADERYVTLEQRARQSQVPTISLGATPWTLTMQIFSTALKIDPNPVAGRGKLSLFSGAGAGLKLRYDYVSGNERKELFGVDVGVVLDQTMVLKKNDPNPTTVYAVGPALMLSTFEYFYFGLGVRTFATDDLPATFGDRVFFFLGLGVDGKTLTN
ncbi:MAG TPA: hypothetical protein VK989_18940 [Polyangia bacterium]|jgi:hypothetical protein|nr:hypothetical protein [Polyangia bacterium]